MSHINADHFSKFCNEETYIYTVPVISGKGRLNPLKADLTAMPSQTRDVCQEPILTLFCHSEGRWSFVTQMPPTCSCTSACLGENSVTSERVGEWNMCRTGCTLAAARVRRRGTEEHNTRVLTITTKNC